MDIQIASGVGTGPTKLAAFDAALHTAGVANFNLIRLSSVIPPGSVIVGEDSPRAAGDEPEWAGRRWGCWGDRLYVVMAERRTEEPNAEAWAGIGWIQDPVDGKGLFVEHEGASEHAVRGDIEESLEALADVRGMKFGPIAMHVRGATCEHRPVCALVVAVFQADGWAQDPDARVAASVAGG